MDYGGVEMRPLRTIVVFQRFQVGMRLIMVVDHFCLIDMGIGGVQPNSEISEQ